MIAELLGAAGGWAVVEMIAVGTGPGTFTGLRIGIATALALGRARDLPLAGVSTLASLALAADPAAAGGRLRRRARRPGRPPPRGVRRRLGDWVADRRRAPPRAGHRPRRLCPGCRPPRWRRMRSPAPLGRSAAVWPSATGRRSTVPCSRRGGSRSPSAASPQHRVDAAVHARLARAGLAVDGDAVRPEYLRAPDAELARRAVPAP